MPDEALIEQIYKPRRRVAKIFRGLKIFFLVIFLLTTVLSIMGIAHPEEPIGAVLFFLIFYPILRWPLRKATNSYLKRTDSRAQQSLLQQLPVYLTHDLSHAWARPMPGVVSLDIKQKILFYQNEASDYTPTFVHLSEITNAKIREKITSEQRTEGTISQGFFSDKVNTKTTSTITDESYHLEIFYERPDVALVDVSFPFGDQRRKAEQFFYSLEKARR